MFPQGLYSLTETKNVLKRFKTDALNVQRTFNCFHDACKMIKLECSFKGDLLCKNHVYKVFEHSCVASVCEKNQPVMVKIHPLIIV